MKNLAVKILVAGAFVVMGLFFFVMRSPTPIHHKSLMVPEKEISLDEFKNLSDEEKKSLKDLSALMAEVVSKRVMSDDLVKKLQTLKLTPIVSTDENAQTGAMDVVRTKEALVGTRYFHAQYTLGDEGKILQHISFELRPGEDSFSAAKKIIQSKFKISSKPSSETADFVVWNRDDRVVWVKRMSEEDLKKHDPYNSYDPKKDIGTIRIASELAN